MTQTIKNFILAGIAALLLLTPVLVPATVGAQNIQGSLCRGSTLSVDSGNCDSVGDSPDRINNLIATIINIFSIVVGIVAVIMIIIGGLKYITSNGDSNSVTSAKNTILYAIIGLVIVALAQFIVQFVLARATGTESGF